MDASKSIADQAARQTKANEKVVAQEREVQSANNNATKKLKQQQILDEMQSNKSSLDLNRALFDNTGEAPRRKSADTYIIQARTERSSVSVSIQGISEVMRRVQDFIRPGREVTITGPDAIRHTVNEFEAAVAAGTYYDQDKT